MPKQRILDLVQKLDGELRENIIDRYHSSEYWEPDVIEDFQIDNKVTPEDMKEILRILG